MVDRRETYITALRELADFLEANPGLPAPYSSYQAAFIDTEEEARKARQGTHGWEKQVGKLYPETHYVRHFGGDDAGRVTYVMLVPPADTCKQVKTGTRIVEAVPEHEEDIMEWRCDGSEK